MRAPLVKRGGATEVPAGTATEVAYLDSCCNAEAHSRSGSRFTNARPEMSKRTVSDEFDGPDATEKAAMEAALNRCRVLARQIESKLRKKRPEHFVDELPHARQ
jgi:hypothetical protein